MNTAIEARISSLPDSEELEINGLHQYIKDISRFPKEFTLEQEEFLFGCHEMGLPIDYLRQSYFFELVPDEQRPKFEVAIDQSKTIKNLIANCHLTLSYYVAKRYGMDQDTLDRVQAGNEGLLHAVDAFPARKDREDGKDLRFGPYAVSWIRKNITDCMAQNRLSVHASQIVRQINRKIIHINDQFELRNGKIPTSEEIIAALAENGFAISDINEVMKLRSLRFLDTPLSIDEILDNIESGEAPRQQTDALLKSLDSGENVESQAVANSDAKNLMDLADTVLTPYQALIFRLSIGLETGRPMSNYEIRKMLGRSQATIGNTLAKARKKLSQSPRIKQLTELVA